MTHVVGISGSLRRKSYNTALLGAAAERMPAGATLEVAGLAGIPLYDGDAEEASGLPPAVVALKQAIAAADGLLLVTPEYNNGIPGVFKNAIDWASRPASDVARVFAGKPVAVIGASMGGFGTILAQNGWLPVLRYLGMRPWFGGRLLVSKAQDAFDGSGRLGDPELGTRLQDFLAGFVTAIRTGH